MPAPAVVRDAGAWRLDWPASEPRERCGKLRDVYKYRKLDEAGTFNRPRMPTPELVVDTTSESPLESARAIARHLRQAVPR